MRKTGSMAVVTVWSALLAVAGTAAAGTGPTDPHARAEAITGIRYEVTYDRSTAERREIHVEMSFDVAGPDPVRLSIPAWTPGSYQLDNYAKNVRAVFARQDGSEIHWDKTDFDTWRVHPAGAGRVTFGFDYLADALDVGSSWTAPDLAAFNGTNIFPFPEGQSLDFDAEMSIRTERDWSVATGMDHAGADRAYRAGHYDELVDMPTFIGAFDLDSLSIDGRWYRLATYPRGALAGQDRTMMWDHIERMMPPMADVFDDVPWDSYTTLIVFEEGLGGGSALEHANSHYGIYDPLFIGNPVLPSITAHEIFHAWNVKRLRPADLWPYEYGRQMPTELLWVSEGITDYYADLALVRGEIVPRQFFYFVTQGKIENVRQTPAVALEDASLSTWVEPRDGTASIYYDKGSLAGFMLDVLIRDASDDARSLDDVMKTMYERAFERGEGFTEDEWWAAMREAAGGRDFRDFHDAYVDGRAPYAWNEILPLAGLRLDERTERVPRIGVTTTLEEAGVRVVEITPDGAADRAGVRVDDLLVRVGDIPVEDNTFGGVFRDRFGARPVGQRYDVVVERDGREVTLEATLEFAEVSTAEIIEDPDASEKARRILRGIVTGS